jgi:hypothetical protein
MKPEDYARQMAEGEFLFAGDEKEVSVPEDGIRDGQHRLLAPVVAQGADRELILGWLADGDQAAPWVPISGDGPWFTRATLAALIQSGRMLVERYSACLHGLLDGQRVVYTESLYGIVSPGRDELKP